jgi:bleomycin hydrolase
MKHVYLFAVGLFSIVGFSQKYEFQTLKDISSLPVISQDKTGTCWSFSSTSFLESEILRIKGQKIDLSEMYNVRYTYPKKAYNYVMRQGKAQFGEGGLAHDVINSALEFGLVPESVYSGKTTAAIHDHSKMIVDLETYLKGVVSTTPFNINWKNEYEGFLDRYLGKPVADFTYEGKKYTPKEFVTANGLDLSKYITLTSFTHAPFYSKFILDIPDNFANGTFYNLPLDEFMYNIDSALDKGYTLALDADVSEKTFSSKTGMAVIPANEVDAVTILSEIKPEKVITQELRQAEFENHNTTDDHLMHLVGKVKDQKGNIYYKVKNSWGKDSGKEGYIYMSVAYMKLKAISVLLHIDGLSKKSSSAIGTLNK